MDAADRPVELVLALHHASPRAFLVSADGEEAHSVWLNRAFATRGAPCGGFERLGRNNTRRLVTIFAFEVRADKVMEMGLR